MALEDLNEEVHRRDFDGGDGFRTEYDPGSTSREEKITFNEGGWDGSQIPDRTTYRTMVAAFVSRHRKQILLGMVGIVIVVAALNYTFFRSVLFAGERVRTETTGPTDVASAESVNYTVHWMNDNVLGVKGLEIVLVFPEEFRPDSLPGMTISGNTATVSVGDVKGGATGNIRFSGKFYGSRGSLTYFRSVAQFTPTGLSGRYESESRFGVTIVSSPLSFDLVAPQEAASGNETEYVISYRNDGDIAFQNLRVRITYPDGFRFNQANPVPTEGETLWNIGGLSPNTGGNIHIRGLLTGGNNQAKTAIVEIGTLQGDGTFLAYDRKDRSTRIIASPLTISQKVGGKKDLTASPGEKLSYQLDYVNAGDIGLRDVIITVEVNAALLDVSQLSLGSGAGSYDVRRGVITWKASDIPNLARLEPRQGGMIQFTVPVRSDIDSGQGLVVRTVAKIDSPDVPFTSQANKVIASDALDVRIGAGARLDAYVSYADAVLPGFGPIPPKVGQETGYTLRFRVTNFLNDLSGTRVVATIPNGARYTGKKSPDTDAVSYNERTGQLIWDIGTMVGGGKSTRELLIQISSVPGPDSVGKQPIILQDSVLEGLDTFTKSSVSVSTGSRMLHDGEGSGVMKGKDIVVP
ncbi:MAG: hypothetical protein HGA33_06050 [Candidatus Moranbacteria bacterium]|nr:hypothetical protein [Candidatus Moranbacteria bacterium]